MVKNIMNSLLGGTDWSRQHPTFQQINDTNNAIIGAALKGQAQVPFTTLKATGDWVNEGYLGADRFKTANGVNGTVQLADSDAVFLTNFFQNNYDRNISLDTTHNPNSFSNPDNAFDNDLDTFAGKSGAIGSYNESFGKTFSPVYIHSVVYKSSTSQGASQGGHSMNLQTFDGSSWTTIETIYSGFDSGSFTRDGKIIINDTIQGIRINFTKGGATTASDRRVYYLNYGGHSPLSELVCKTLELDNETVATLYTDAIIPVDTSLHATIGDGTSETDEFELQPNKTTLIPLLPNMSGDMQVKFIFRTTNTAVTPELYGYGVYLN